MKNSIKKIPTPICGLMLALGSLGNLLSNYSLLIKNICFLLSIIIFIFMAFKILFFINDIKNEFNNPVIASVMPTFSMGLMIISTFLKPLNYHIAFLFFIFGYLIHIGFILMFSKKYLFNFDINKVFPSYFVVYVGIAVCSLTSKLFNLDELGKYSFYFALFSYILLLPLVIYRVFSVKNIKPPVMPTLTIFAAPASLLLAGYITAFDSKNTIIINLLAFISIITFILVILYIPKMMKAGFFPSFSAFTFPIVISTIASKKLNLYLNTKDVNIEGLKYLISFQEILSTFFVFYVLYLYIKNISKIIKESSIA